MAPFVRRLREWRYRDLSYFDDFLVLLSPFGSRATEADYEMASEKIDELIRSRELKRNPTKGVLGRGKTRLEHLGVLVNSELMIFAATY